MLEKAHAFTSLELMAPRLLILFAMQGRHRPLHSDALSRRLDDGFGPLLARLFGFLTVSLFTVIAIAVSIASPTEARAVQCHEVFDGSLKHALTSDLLEHYAGEELGREILVTNGEFSRRIWFRTEYLSEREARKYLVSVVEGRLVDARGRLLDSKYTFIFVMDQRGRVYATNRQQAGLFHHSSFVSGRPVAAAGEFRVRNGFLESISARSGHYQPSWRQLRQFIRELESRGANVPASAKETFDPSP